MAERSLRAITGCCEKCGTTLRRMYGSYTSPSATKHGPAIVWMGESSYCPRCDTSPFVGANWSTGVLPGGDSVQFDEARPPP